MLLVEDLIIITLIMAWALILELKMLRSMVLSTELRKEFHFKWMARPQPVILRTFSLMQEVHFLISTISEMKIMFISQILYPTLSYWCLNTNNAWRIMRVIFMIWDLLQQILSLILFLLKLLLGLRLTLLMSLNGSVMWINKIIASRERLDYDWVEFL